MVLLGVSSVSAESSVELVKTKPAGFVSDFASLLSVEQKASIESLIQAHKEKTGGSNGGDEIAVVTIKTLDGDSLENFANNLFSRMGYWK